MTTRPCSIEAIAENALQCRGRAWGFSRDDRGSPCPCWPWDGRPLRMLLDTGATLSALPADAAASLGLLPTASPGMLLGVAGLIPLSHAYAGTLEIGATRIDGQRFLELPAGKTALLGLDVLSRFDLLVVPGQRLLLRARGDLRATAAARIRRWTWLPVCASPACVRAHLEPAGRNGSLELTIEAALPRPVHLL